MSRRAALIARRPSPVSSLVVTIVSFMLVLSMAGTSAALVPNRGTGVDGERSVGPDELASETPYDTRLGGVRSSRQSTQRQNDTTVLWRGFRHAWSYNHRFNRFGSWVNPTNCDTKKCKYEVGHSAASGTGPDLAAVRDAYTELSARNVGFVSGTRRFTIVGPEQKAGPAKQRFDGTITVNVSTTTHPELQGHNNYAALLNGFDATSRGIAAKLIDFNLAVKNARKVGNKIQFKIVYDILMDCDSFECKGPGGIPRGGKAVQTVDYAIDVHYLVVGGDTGKLNVVEGSRQDSYPDWGACRNNGVGPGNSDEFNLGPDNGFPQNHMWCENSKGREVSHEDYWQNDTIAGRAPRSGQHYSVGAVGIKSIHLGMDEEAHFTQYDTIVGGSYNASNGSYDVRALPFFKEWSSRPGMFQKARLSYGFDSDAHVRVDPVMLQIANGCKRSFVTGGRKKWKGKGASATTPDAIVNETYQFSFGDTWYGYGHSRGNYCNHPERPGNISTQREQEVTGRTLKWKNAFPLRDGYPPGVADTGDRIDLWNEYRQVSRKTPQMNREKIVQDPTQLRGRPSDRFYNQGPDSRPHANISKINVTALALHATPAYRIVDREHIDLANLPGNSRVRGIEDVVFEEPAVYQKPAIGSVRSREVQIRINDSVPEYEVEAYFHDPDEPNEEWINQQLSSSRPNVTVAYAEGPGDYALELLVYCPDRSCQPVHAMIPFYNPTKLNLRSLNNYHNTTEFTASNAREDLDYYEFHIGNAERISNASIRNGPGLTLTLQNESGTELRTVDSGEVMSTNTDVTGTYYLAVSGDGVTDRYTLNLTTQFVSQKYEENDHKQAAYNLDPDISVNNPQVQLKQKRGSNRWCRSSGGSNSNKAGSTSRTGNLNPGRPTICHRHDWWEALRTPTGYSPSDPDWYSVTLDRNERLEVNVSDERLGVEVVHAGRTVASLPANASRTTLKHITTSPGTYYVNITGENVARHTLKVRWIRTDGLDRLEANDKRATATRVSAPVGNSTTEYDFLRLAGADTDYFRVNLQSGDTLNASLTHLRSPGTVDLTVVAPNGNLTRAPQSRRAQFSGGVRLKRANLTARRSGNYYVKVNGSGRVALMYNLTIETDKAKRSIGSRFAPEERYEFDHLDTDRWHTRDVPTPEEIAKAIMFEEIGLNPDSPLEGFEMRVDVRRAPPDGVPPLKQALAGNERYLVVRHEVAFEGSSRIRVRVNREVLAERDADPENLAIYRHSGADGGKWEQVDTEIIGTDEESVVLEGTADGLSVFAIGTTEGTLYRLFGGNQAIYNEQVQQVPDVLLSIVANERVNMRISTDDGVRTIGVVMDGKRVSAVHPGGLEDPTLIVQTSETTVREIATAPDPSERAVAALKKGRISYHGVGAVNVVKYTVLKVVVGVLEFVGDTFGVGPFR